MLRLRYWFNFIFWSVFLVNSKVKTDNEFLTFILEFIFHLRIYLPLSIFFKLHFRPFLSSRPITAVIATWRIGGVHAVCLPILLAVLLKQLGLLHLIIVFPLVLSIFDFFISQSKIVVLILQSHVSLLYCNWVTATPIRLTIIRNLSRLILYLSLLPLLWEWFRITRWVFRAIFIELSYVFVFLYILRRFVIIPKIFAHFTFPLVPGGPFEHHLGSQKLLRTILRL